MNPFENFEEFSIWMDKVKNRPDSEDYIRWHQGTVLGLNEQNPGKLNMAKSAFVDLYDELDINDRKSIFDTLYKDDISGVPVQLGGNGDNAKYEYRDIFTQYMPAMIQKGNRRNAHGHLIDILKHNSTFKEGIQMYEDDRISIAQHIYRNYRVIDTGGTENLVFSTSELDREQLDITDVEKGIPYMLMYFDKKKGHEIVPIPDDANLSGKNVIDTVQRMNDDIKAQYGSEGTMWISFRRNNNSTGMEAVIMGGIHSQGRYRPVGRPKIIQDDGPFSKQLNKKTIQDMIIPNKVAFQIIKDAKSYYFMEAQNDWYETNAVWQQEQLEKGIKQRPNEYGGATEISEDHDYSFLGQDTLKTKIGDYYKKFGKMVENPDTGKKSMEFTQENSAPLFSSWKRVPHWAIEMADPRKFEYDNIIKPFWEEHKDKSEPEFEKAWNLHITEHTYNWKDRWWNEMWEEISTAIGPPRVFQRY